MKTLKQWRKMNRKGVLGLDTVTAVIVTLLILAVTAIAVFLALTSLQDANLFTAGSQAANDTDQLINNITSGTTDFFANIPTVMAILGAVIIILAVVLIIIAVGRIRGGAQASL